MLAFRHTVRANDTTIKRYITIASRLGDEGVHWTYEWMDGRRAVFAFDTERHRKKFAFMVGFEQLMRLRSRWRKDCAVGF
jgi:hypothetical protein